MEKKGESMILIVGFKCVEISKSDISNLNLSEIIEKLIVFDHQKASNSIKKPCSGSCSLQPILGSRGFLSQGERTQKMGRSKIFRSGAKVVSF